MSLFNITTLKGLGVSGEKSKKGLLSKNQDRVAEDLPSLCMVYFGAYRYKLHKENVNRVL